MFKVLINKYLLKEKSPIKCIYFINVDCNLLRVNT